MTTLREAAQQALEALAVATNCLDGYYIPRGQTTLPEIEDAIAALKAALAEPVQEPVAWRYKYSDGFWRFSNGSRVNGCDPIESQALYTAPPRRKPLTEEEIDALALVNSYLAFARAIERAHGIGGNYEWSTNRRPAGSGGVEDDA